MLYLLEYILLSNGIAEARAGCGTSAIETRMKCKNIKIICSISPPRIGTKQRWWQQIGGAIVINHSEKRYGAFSIPPVYKNVIYSQPIFLVLTLSFNECLSELPMWRMCDLPQKLWRTVGLWWRFLLLEGVNIERVRRVPSQRDSNSC